MYIYIYIERERDIYIDIDIDLDNQVRCKSYKWSLRFGWQHVIKAFLGRKNGFPDVSCGFSQIFHRKPTPVSLQIQSMCYQTPQCSGHFPWRWRWWKHGTIFQAIFSQTPSWAFWGDGLNNHHERIYVYIDSNSNNHHNDNNNRSNNNNNSNNHNNSDSNSN